MMAQPSNPGGPPRDFPALYHAGDACPFCGLAVEFADPDVAPVPAPGGIRARAWIGGPLCGAVLMPCGHHVDRMTGPGNGGPPAAVRLAAGPRGV